MPTTKSVSCFFIAVLLFLSLGCARAIRSATRLQSIEARTLMLELATPNPPLVLDVRDSEDFQKGHIPGARSVQAKDVEAFVFRSDISPKRTVVVVCYSGHLSSFAGASASAWHRGPVKDLAGGMEAWNAQGLAISQGNGETVPSEMLAPATKVMSWSQQMVASVLFAFVKPLYMLICLLLILALRKARSAPMRLLFWALVCFDLGEAFCALDYLFSSGSHVLIAPLDLLHGLGMVGMGVLAPWALFRLADDRVLHYGDPKLVCSIQRFCGNCWKRQQAQCGLHQLFLYTQPALLILALLPLSIAIIPPHYVTNVFGTSVLYGAPILNEMVELWGYSILGSLCFLITFLVLLKGPSSTHRAELPFFLGLGFSGFAVFRFFLHTAFRHSVNISDFWEEITELIAICAIALALYIFRSSLGLVDKKATPAVEEA